MSTILHQSINLSNYSKQFDLADLWPLPNLYFGCITTCCCADTLSFSHSRSHEKKLNKEIKWALHDAAPTGMPLHSINSRLHLVCTCWLWASRKVIEVVWTKVPTTVKQPLRHTAYSSALTKRWANIRQRGFHLQFKVLEHTSTRSSTSRLQIKLFTPTWASAAGSEEDGAAASVISRKLSHYLQVSPRGTSFPENTAVRKHIFTQVWLSVARDFSTQFAYRWGWELVSVCSWM